MTPTPTIRRYVSAAYTAMMRGQWDVASECFNRANQECLVMASQPSLHVPAPGALAGDYLELASRATDPGAKAYWVKLAEEESNSNAVHRL